MKDFDINLMNKIKTLLISIAILIGAVAFAENIEVRLENGDVWAGVIGQTITVEYDDKGNIKKYSGEITRATNTYIMVLGDFLFINNIISITGEDEEIPEPNDTSIASDKTIEEDKEGNSLSEVKKPNKIIKEGDLPKGVFCLPLHEMVGTYFRDNEITQLIDYIEEHYGLGQIIILEIHSGGGAVHIWDKIRNVIFEARDRHRFIAWIESAGSGAAATAFLCDEIFYRSDGYVGAITMYSGDINNVAPDWQMDGWVRELESVIARTSHSPLIAGSMVRSKNNFSYDIDPETGVFTYYDHEFGDHVLSKSGRNMMLSPAEALHSGMSDGTANSGEELAVFLDLEKWNEIDTFGRDIAREWTETLKEFEIEGPKLIRKFQGDVDAKTPKQALTERIKAGQALLKWHKRIGDDTWPMVARGADIESIKREIKNLEHQKQTLND